MIEIKFNLLDGKECEVVVETNELLVTLQALEIAGVKVTDIRNKENDISKDVDVDEWINKRIREFDLLVAKKSWNKHFSVERNKWINAIDVKDVYDSVYDVFGLKGDAK